MKMRILFTQDDIATRLDSLADEINRNFQGKDLVVIPLLRGGFVFASDLVRRLQMPVEIDFLTTSSYEDAQSSSGVVEMLSDLRCDISGRDVLLVDDIIDSGHTLKVVRDYLAQRGPRSIRLCTMLDKPARRTVAIQPDFVGFTIEDVFIVGYGLDYGRYYRNVPYIFTFEEEEHDS